MRHIENLKEWVPYNISIGEPDNPDTHLVEVEEEWRNIPGFPYYRASSFGRICSLDKRVKGSYAGTAIKQGRLLKLQMSKRGYYYASITHLDGKRRNTKVHRMISLAFNPDVPGKPHINHKDNVKTNNVPTNLEWCTQSENCKHRDTFHKHSSINSLTKSVILTHIYTNERLLFVSIGEAARRIGASKSLVQKALKHKFNVKKLYKVEVCA